MSSRRPVVALDLMDTVLVDPFREALHAATGLSVREIFSRRDPGSYPAFERGELSEADYWQAFRDAGIAFDADAFHEARRSGYRWIDGMVDLIADLDGHARLVAASNYPHWISELESGLLAGRFEHVHVSYRVGARKPDAAFYTALLDEVGAVADQVFFVDDRDVNVAGAREVGLHAHRFTDTPSLRSWLRDAASLPV